MDEWSGMAKVKRLTAFKESKAHELLDCLVDLSSTFARIKSGGSEAALSSKLHDLVHKKFPGIVKTFQDWASSGSYCVEFPCYSVL